MIDESKKYAKNVIIILVSFIILTIVGFIVTEIIEPKLEVQEGILLEVEKEIIEDSSYYMDNPEKYNYYVNYKVQDKKTNEIITLNDGQIMFPYSFFVGFLPIKNVLYSTYEDAGLYNIMIIWKLLGIFGIFFCILCIVRNPYKRNNL